MTRSAGMRPPGRVRPAARLLVALIGVGALAGGAARADTEVARRCAAALPQDARAIFDATLPQLAPGANLRELVTATTRRLVEAGSIGRGSARDSAVAAGKCLRTAD